MSVGRRLREERSRLGLTQAVVVAKTGISLRQQKYFESDTHKPGGAYLEQLAAIGVDVQYVLTGVLRSEDEPVYDPDAPVPPGENLGEMARAVGARLLEWRTASRKDGPTLAALLGVSAEELSRIEYGRAPLRWSALCSLAEAGLSIDWLLWGLGEP